MLNDIVNMVSGDIRLEECEVLFDLVQKLPNDAVILDFCPGLGRSSVVAALALRASNVSGIIAAIDTHMQALSSTPYRDGTLPGFLDAIHRYGLNTTIIPMLGPLSLVPKLFNRKSANMVIIQAPKSAGNLDDFLVGSLEIARGALRTKGHIVVFCPDGNVGAAFDHAAESMLIGLSERRSDFMRIYTNT